MRKLKLVLPLACAIFTGSAFAVSTGELTFNGIVLSDSCSISTSAGADQTISLPSSYVSDYSGVGTSPAATGTMFNIEISGCASDDYVIQFPAAANSVNLNGEYVKNVATSAASGVDLAVYDNTSTTPLSLSTSPKSTLQNVATDGAVATFPFSVDYIQTDSSISAGNVQGKLKYEIAYH